MSNNRAFVGIVVGVTVGLLLATFSAMVSLYVTVNKGESWRLNEWPLEQMLLLTEHQQMRDEIGANRVSIETLNKQHKKLERELWESQK